MTELRMETSSPDYASFDSSPDEAPDTLGAAVKAAARGGLPSSPQPARPDTGLTPSMDTQFGGDTVLPVDSRANAAQPTVVGTPSKPLREGVPTELSELEFEAIQPATQIVDPDAPAPAPASVAEPLNFDLNLTPPAPSKAPAMPRLPDIDLNLTPPPVQQPARPPAPAPAGPGAALDFGLPSVPPAAPPPEPAAPARAAKAPPPQPAQPTPRPAAPQPLQPSPRPAPSQESLAGATLLGGLTALPEGVTRMGPSTDQATVPLIDFDLTGADLPLNTNPGRGGAQTGSPMAAQIATKLDLARGYIDLGVKDGARELLDEVIRDGTREQRQSAIELMKQIDR
jgi:pilus assembly protein FimV